MNERVVGGVYLSGKAKTFKDILVVLDIPRPSISGGGGEFMLVCITGEPVMTKPRNMEKDNKLVCKREMGQCEVDVSG